MWPAVLSFLGNIILAISGSIDKTKELRQKAAELLSLKEKTKDEIELKRLEIELNQVNNQIAVQERIAANDQKAETWYQRAWRPATIIWLLMIVPVLNSMVIPYFPTMHPITFTGDHWQLIFALLTVGFIVRAYEKRV